MYLYIFKQDFGETDIELIRHLVGGKEVRVKKILPQKTTIFVPGCTADDQRALKEHGYVFANRLSFGGEE